MAEDGSGVIARQPARSPLRGLFSRSRSGDQPTTPELAALDSTPGGQAVSNDYTDPPEHQTGRGSNAATTRTLKNNNDTADPTNSTRNTHHAADARTPLEQLARTSLVVVTDPQHGKTKLVKVVRREPSRTSDTSACSTSPLHADSKDPYPCQVCGGCRCDKCRARSELPKINLCNGRCECPVDHVLECCSCMCCVKGLFYHCTDHENEENYALVDDPCSCSSDRCCLRWSVMGLMSVVMPCLWLYVPGRICIFGCKRCYAQGRHGCKCKDSEYGTL